MSRRGLTIEGILGPTGALSVALPGYEHRTQQMQLSHAIERALSEHRHLVAEAGTGTGKTLAYLVPAVLSGRRVVISTATRTLQEQLMLKAIPLLRDVVGLDFSAAMLQGRANYLCAQRFEAFDKNPLFDTPEAATHWPRFRDWAFATETGERGETRVPENWSIWPKVTTTPEACAGTACPLYEGCFVTRARRHAEDCQVVVVNHALFFADVALRARGKELGLRILPPYDAVIFDEAHALEDVATDHFGFSASWGRLANLADDVMKAVTPLQRAFATLSALALSLRSQADAFFDGAASLLGLPEGKDLRLAPETLAQWRPQGVVVLESLAAIVASCPEDDVELNGIKRRAGELGDALERLLAADDPSFVYWAQSRGNGGRKLTLHAAPIEVGEALRNSLYDEVKSVIFTSATLAVANEKKSATASFDYVLHRFGVPHERAEVLRVASPFDYAKQSALYVPRHLPEPNDPSWTDVFAAEVESLVELSEGRAFILFTSLRHMEHVYGLLANRLPYQALKQGDLPRRALLDEFVKAPSVLFASQSFWEGVDVPGDALSLVVIDRLPFAPPGEPLQSARMEAVRAKGLEPFNSYQVPQAALSLRQGFGRLIRTATDRGIVALGDTRLLTKRYGKVFLDSLPPSQRFSRFDPLQTWWRSAR